MASHNVWTFSGNLGSDPETRQVGDRMVCNFSVAVNGRRDDPTTWVRVAVWGAQADACARFLAKGRQVIVTGAARLREYEGKNGKGVSLEVDARDVTFIGGRDDAQATPSQGGGNGGWGDKPAPASNGGWGSKPAPSQGWGAGPQGQPAKAAKGSGGWGDAPADDPVPF